MQVKVTVLSKEEVYKKYPPNVITHTALYSRVTAETTGCFIACVEGLKGSGSLFGDLQRAMDEFVGKSYKATIYSITDMSEYYEDKVYCAFSKETRINK